MDKEVGVGLIIGLIIGVVTLIYNYIKNIEARRIEKEQNQQQVLKLKNYSIIESKKNKLNSLLESGLLNETEYKAKTHIIEDEILEQKLKESDDYKHLVELHNQNVFTDDEFQLKIALLKNQIEKLKPEIKDSKPELNYQPVDYLVQSKTIKKSWLMGDLEIYQIKYHDEKEGRVYFNKRTSEFYFAAKKRNEDYYFYYENLDSCAKGLHYHLTNGKTLQKGYLGFREDPN